MAFDENLDVFFAEKDFAVTAKIGGRELKVIFDSPTEPAIRYDTEVEAEALYFHCKTHEFSATGAKDNSTVEIDGTTYKIKKIERDGTGVSTVHLKT